MKFLLSIVLPFGTLLFLDGIIGFSAEGTSTRNVLSRRQGQYDQDVRKPLITDDGKPVSDSDVSKYSQQKNGNYIVDPKTGHLCYEYVPDEDRASLASTYADPSLATSEATRAYLKKITIEKGIEMNKSESTKEIPAFVKKYKINMNLYKRKNISQYCNFNDFFAREIDLTYRPIEGGSDTILSPADSRVVVFDNVESAKSLWIKGKQFSAQKLLNVEKLDPCYNNASLAIFRLATQDYHRYHAPVDGKVVSIKDITGDYYSVSPIAVRQNIDVFTENHRVVVEIQRPNGDRVGFVCIGTTLVGSVKLSVSVGSEVKRGDEVGHFLYGGSTIIILSPNMRYSRGIQTSSNEQLETLVSARSGVGRMA